MLLKNKKNRKIKDFKYYTNFFKKIDVHIEKKKFSEKIKKNDEKFFKGKFGDFVDQKKYIFNYNF